MSSSLQRILYIHHTINRLIHEYIIQLCNVFTVDSIDSIGIIGIIDSFDSILIDETVISFSISF